MQDITHAKLEEAKALLKMLRHHMEKGVTPEWEMPLLAIMQKAFFTFFSLERKEVITEIQRVTVNRRLNGGNNKRLSNISQIKYPPGNLVGKYGRCNIKQMSVLYAAFDNLTVLSELKPEVGDLITISFWENKEKVPMRCFGIIGNHPSQDVINRNTYEVRKAYEAEQKNYPLNLRELFKIQTDFLADAFSKFIKPGDNLSYLFTAFFSGELFFESGAEAIIYPSVQQRLSFENIAIKAPVFDKIFTLKKATEQIVLASPFGKDGNAYGTFSHQIAKAQTVEGGLLKWENSYDKDLIDAYAEEYGITFS